MSGLLELLDSLLFMLIGMFMMIDGGWLLLWCTYKGVLFGLLNGLNVPVFRLSVMSKATAHCQTYKTSFQAIIKLFCRNTNNHKHNNKTKHVIAEHTTPAHYTENASQIM